jgi:hypothetical protein
VVPLTPKTAAEKSLGRIKRAENSKPLGLTTGIDDDERRILQPADEQYRLAAYAWRYQDDWSLEEHRDFWSAAMPHWPKAPGKRPLQDTLAWWTYVLRQAGRSEEEIAATWHIRSRRCAGTAVSSGASSYSPIKSSRDPPTHGSRRCRAAGGSTRTYRPSPTSTFRRP